MGSSYTVGTWVANIDPSFLNYFNTSDFRMVARGQNSSSSWNSFSNCTWDSAILECWHRQLLEVVAQCWDEYCLWITNTEWIWPAYDASMTSICDDLLGFLWAGKPTSHTPLYIYTVGQKTESFDFCFTFHGSAAVSAVLKALCCEAVCAHLIIY